MTDQAPRTEKPEPSEENRREAERMAEAYKDERPTAVMPGSNRTVTGTAVNDWLDDEGNPKADNSSGDD